MLKNIAMFLVVAFIILSVSYYVFSEDITITTYYPSPYGSYRELRAQNMSIGQNYSTSDYCWPPASCSHPINRTADLVVEGSTGIGIFDPHNMLEVNGTVVIGGNYSGNSTFIAPGDSLLVEGGIGVNRTNITTNAELDVNGAINASSYWVGGIPGFNSTLTVKKSDVTGSPCTINVTRGLITNSTCF
jgi:hypothetical protein